MSSPQPLKFGYVYHIYNQGNNRESIFKEQRNYIYFLKLYKKYVSPISDTFAYCLLNNHFHFLLRVKEQDEIDLKEIKPPSQYFSNMFNAYTKAINKAYNRKGSLFQRPFQRKIIPSEEYFYQLVDYIHFNPIKHGFVNHIKDWPYSSYHRTNPHRPIPQILHISLSPTL